MLALACACLAGLPVSSAQAAPDARIGLEDERLLLSEPAEAPQIVTEWARLGVDVVRLHARFASHAPGANARRRPSGFSASDHRSRGYRWDELDNAIRLVTAAGMKVMLTVTGPGPAWTSRAPSKGGRYKPDPKVFGQFARAVATRYGSQVDEYLLYNEPNQSGWLSPQYDCATRNGKKTCTPVAPHLYRELVRSGVPAIKRADAGAKVYIGEFAPVGRRGSSSGTPIAPLKFLREMGCVDDRYRRMTSGACRGFKPVSGDGLGYHPHGVLDPPDRPSKNPDEAKFADVDRLFRVLDRLTRARRIIAPGNRFDVHMTEFGYQTSPPDHAVGVTLAQQVRYLQQAAYITWRHPRIKTLMHYQWRDEPVFERGTGQKAYSGWQSGLRYLDDRPKPAMHAWSQPFLIDTSSGTRSARFWGQVRPGRVQEVRVQRQSGGGEWSTIATLQTDTMGYWSRQMAIQSGARYRYAWGDDADASYGGPERRRSGVVTGSGGGTKLRAAAY